MFHTRHTNDEEEYDGDGEGPVYSHDTVGLGHLRRTMLLAQGLHILSIRLTLTVTRNRCWIGPGR